ncbi:glutamine synthetase [Candidatus Gracilibacteria bacterium]|nr:glutamine synthetase [Candidatus Gracilibacteria bacterium]
MERISGVTSDEMQDKFLTYLAGESGIKAVIVFFTDLEGRLQALDYDKNFIVDSHENLTFDGSSIKGFSELSQSDLRLGIDWTSFRWLPADLFGSGKVMVFANVRDRDGSLYSSDFRSNLVKLCAQLKKDQGVIVNVAPEIEGFLFKGVKAEQQFNEVEGFELGTMSGYFSSLPQDTLRIFIDKFAEVQRALGFQNEKDHPEVAPAQFELNFRYTIAVDCADQIQLYKLLARQVATTMGLTASFLPKPIQNLNGSGMHTNLSLSKDGVNMFYDAKGKEMLSQGAHDFVTGVLYHAKDLCLLMNPSVNSYRRLDPAYEAPNEIKVSSVDRGSMIRIPLGNEKSARIEVRTVAPDVNPYLCFFAILKAGIKGMTASIAELEKMKREVYEKDVEKLPGDIYAALADYNASTFLKDEMGADNHRKYAELKSESADRSPRALGSSVKAGEVLYHHEVTNQLIWDKF